MPYPFAHPAAVLPLARPLGRFAVPSALAIGSMVPDLWYVVPFVERADSHDLAGLFWFCLPAGMVAYGLFHLLLKEPLVALLWPRLASFACAGLPRRPWSSVLISLLTGSATHLTWDELTHVAAHAVHGINLPQHASTIAGTAVLAWWIRRKLRSAPPPGSRHEAAFLRVCAVIALVGVMLVCALCSADAWPTLDVASVRHFLRTAGIRAIEGLAAALFAYCVVWQLHAKRATRVN